MRRCVWALTVLAVLAALVVPATATVFDDTAESAWQTNSGGQVLAIASTPSAVFVGGTFVSMEDGQGGAPLGQARLAALDPTTGALLPGFAPTINGTVRAVAATPDGSRLFVGGAFSVVNGQSVTGVVELDPTTGAVVNNLQTGTTAGVFDIALDGDWLYVVGNITRVGPVVVSGAGRFNIVSGQADAAWTPTLANGPARAVAPQAGTDRVYLGGYFQTTNGDPSHGKFTAVSAVDGTLDPHFDPDIEVEVFDLAATVDKVYAAVGGPGGRAEVRDGVTGQLIRAHTTDGDVQSVEVSDERVTFGHHGELLNGVFAPWVFAIDRADDSVDTSFAPSIVAGHGFGVWAVHDAGDHLWVGGSIFSASPVDGVGFLRFPAAAAQPNDVVAPTAPTNLTATSVADTFVELDWADSLDDSGALYYRVLRDGVLVGVSSDSQFLDATVPAATTLAYVIEAVDAAQNAASSAPMHATTLPPLTPAAPFALGATWEYLDIGGPAPAGWDLAGFDAAAWESGPGELGREDGDEATVVDHPPAPSVTVYLRHEFDIPAGFTAAAAQLSYLRDDGVIIRVNGVEVLRDNLPAGPIDHTTRASVWQTAEEATIFTVALSPTPFVEGTNVVSVELHNAGSSGDLSFDAALNLGLVDDTSPPTQPTALAAPAVDASTVSLTWTPSTDDQGVTGYRVERDGVTVGTSPIASFTDAGLAASTTYTYAVVALDAAGNESPPSTSISVTTDAPAPDPVPPTPPAALAVLAVGETSVSLAWGAATDNVGVTGYEVLRDGVVVATATTTSHLDLGLAPSTTYTYEVRAFDAAGNFSAPSGSVSATTEATPPTPVEVLPFGHTWRYLDSGQYPGASWVLAAYDDALWPSGGGHIGVGDGDETTVVTSRPTIWLRSTFDVADPAAVVSAGLEMIADDGAVVFVNGVEVVRDNVPAGTPDGSISASSYRYLAAEDQARTFDVPAGVLTAGTNTIAVALVNGSGSGDMSFDLRLETLVGAPAPGDALPPTVPANLAVDSLSDASVGLVWSPSTDDVAVAGYRIYRDNVLAGTSAVATFVDSGLSAATTHVYEVEAFDPAGNTSARSAALVATTLAAPPVESVLLPFGTTWRYLDTGVVPATTWIDPGFDDASWSLGAAPLGANNPGVTTIVNQPATWIRTTVDVPVADDVVALEVDLQADDAAVVFINGVEVVRDNLAPGPFDGSVPALGYRWGSAETETRTFVVPAGVLVDGVNTIAVVMINGNGSSDSRIDLAIRQFTQP